MGWCCGSGELAAVGYAHRAIGGRRQLQGAAPQSKETETPYSRSLHIRRFRPRVVVHLVHAKGSNPVPRRFLTRSDHGCHRVIRTFGSRQIMDVHDFSLIFPSRSLRCLRAGEPRIRRVSSHEPSPVQRSSFRVFLTTLDTNFVGFRRPWTGRHLQAPTQETPTFRPDTMKDVGVPESPVPESRGIPT